MIPITSANWRSTWKNIRQLGITDNAIPKGAIRQSEWRRGIKPFRDALRLEIAAAGPNHKALRRIARRLIKDAEAGNLAAILAVADRLDGRPAQEASVTVYDKRDATDWTRDELVAFLSERRADRLGIAAPDGRGGEADRVH